MAKQIMLLLLWVGELKTVFHTGWSKTLGVLAMEIKDMSKLKEVGNCHKEYLLIISLIIWIILDTCKTAKDCTWVQCTKDGQAVPVPAPPPAAAQSSCDMKQMFDWYGMHPFSGSIQLMVGNNGKRNSNFLNNLNFPPKQKSPFSKYH